MLFYSFLKIPNKRSPLIMQQLSIQEIKAIEVDILSVFAEFCDSNNLKYFLSYGTLLGAIRHKGFIPWDDDIDITMPRDDYDKLQSLLEEKNNLFNDHIELKTPDSKNYQYQFCKIIDNKTLAYEKNMKDRYKTSIWIDIFPIDKIPSDPGEQEQFISKLLKMRKFYFYTIEKKLNGEGIFKHIKYTIVKTVMTPIYQLINQKKRIAKLAKKYQNLNTDYRFFSLNGDSYKTVFKESLLNEQTVVTFENREFKTFKDYDTILTQIFGDYMKLPPLDQRIPHGFLAYYK